MSHRPNHSPSIGTGCAKPPQVQTLSPFNLLLRDAISEHPAPQLCSLCQAVAGSHTHN